MKRLLVLLLAFVMFTVCLTACGGGEKVDQINADDIKLVTATDAVYSSYLYVIEDREAIEELVDLYNSLRYDPEPADVDITSDLMTGTLYTLNFENAPDQSSISDLGASCYLSPDGYIMFRDMTAYKLLSNFDEARLKAILKEYNTLQSIE